MTKKRRTIVYVDGYNLYYGRLKNTQLKWLDIVKLFETSILPSQIPHAEVLLVKYFTSPVLGNFSSHGMIGMQSQQNYHRALEALYPTKLKVIKGYHQPEAVHMPKYHGNGPVNKADNHKVWKLSEKQTDVNIALHLYRDASLGYCDAQVVCSNDTDLEPAFSMIRQDNFPIELGLVIPTQSHKNGNNRPPNKTLSTLANWTRSHINDQELSDSQLPAKIPTRKKPILKPDYW